MRGPLEQTLTDVLGHPENRAPPFTHTLVQWRLQSVELLTSLHFTESPSASMVDRHSE